MALDSALHSFGLIFQVFLFDLILSGDNAVVIALACRELSSQQRAQAVMIGTGAAIALRVLLTALAGWLLHVPLLKLAGAAMLIVIAIRLLIEEEQDSPLSGDSPPPSGMLGAVTTVLIADLVMSLDNVVALAAVTQGSIFYLVLGLLLSVPLLMYGSVLMTGMLDRYPLLIPAAGALLGYVAGDIAVSDPIITEWINTQSPALTVVVPVLCAIFVVAESRIIERQRASLPRPERPTIAPVTVAPARYAPVAAPIEKIAAAETASVSEAPPSMPMASEKTPRSLLKRYWPIPVAAMGLLPGLAFWYALGGGLMPKPAADNAYSCQGGITIYYRHGGTLIRITSGGGEAVGRVDYKEISWGDLQAVTNKLHFTPPSEIENSGATTVTINGGNFHQIQCTLQK